MPVYLRKNVSYTPPSIDKLPPESEDDYVNDPELLKDVLPQPYRMIDKTLTDLIDETWEVIAKREQERLEEARRVKPPQYEYALKLEDPVPGSQKPDKQCLANAASICGSSDGNFVFIGLQCGLTVLDSASQQFLASWEDERAEITYMKVYTLRTDVYLLVTIDDMGVGRLFAFTNNKLFMIRVLNSNPQDSDNKTLVSKLEASREGDYLGMVMENPSNRDVWLEVHKLPRDTWLSDLDTIMAAVKKKEEKSQEAQEPGDTESVVASEVAGSQADAQEANIGSGHSGAPPLDTAEGSQDPLSGDFKFASPNLIMKVTHPATITGVTVSSLQSTLQKMDNPDVVGVGQNTLFTANHLDQRQSMFNQLHENLLKYLPEEEDSNSLVQYPNFHFLTAGRMLPQGLEQQSLQGRPTTVAVWWPGTTNLVQYSLLKTSKDLEFKPDLVWPFSCKISCTEVSPDTNIIAVGLENGSLVIWDKYMGTQKGVINVRDDSAVTTIRFLDPCLYPQDVTTGAPYQTGCGIYLLVMCANSALYTVSTGPGAPLQANLIALPAEKEDNSVTVLQPFTSQPEMLLTVTRSGHVEIRDILKGTVLCQVSLPSNYELLSPWEPLYTLGNQGQMLYLKGVPMTQAEDESIDMVAPIMKGSLFVYKLKFFPTLDPYWAKKRTPQPYTVHTTLNDRVDAFFTQRVKEQLNRKWRMQERWTQLKSEIAHINKLKEDARIRAESRNLVQYNRIQFPLYQTPGSVGLMPGINLIY